MVDHPPLSPSVETMRQPVLEGTTRPLPWRMEQLERLQGLLAGAESALLEALAEDLGKPPLEAYVELAGVHRAHDHIVIDETEALSAIDVNTGRHKSLRYDARLPVLVLDCDGVIHRRGKVFGKQVRV